MSYLVRNTDRKDIPHLGRLLNDYYQGDWRGNIERLEQDLAEKIFKIFVVENANQELVGFISWAMTYDFNWCMKGGDIIDFYVSPNHRGRGAALLLTIGAATEIQRRGGVFLKGGAANPVVRRFYGRIAMCLPDDGECYISGRAFRHLAALSGKELREIVKNLPQTAWNYEP